MKHLKDCRELAYIRGILKDFYGAECPSTPTYIDNQACIATAKMPVFSEKQKHIPIRVCHLRECCSNKMVEKFPPKNGVTPKLPSEVAQCL